MLQDKNVIIYGGGGNIGGAFARTFAREGARLFLTGRTESTLDAVAKDVETSGGKAQVTVLDPCDERAVEGHANAFVAQAGSIDVSVNPASRNDVQGTPLVEMSVADYTTPVTTGITTNFITARAAAVTGTWVNGTAMFAS